jgi:hypothetical protein
MASEVTKPCNHFSVFFTKKKALETNFSVLGIFAPTYQFS